MQKILLITAGMISLFLGVLGIFVPGLPTTPFMLLTATLFIRSSPRLHRWLLQNRYLGKYVLNYQRRKGMTRRQKIYALSLMWIMIAISSGFLIHQWPIRILVIAAGVVGTVVMGFIVPLAKNDSESK
jgi:uncharacterized membrane protein YbaN (DUF454 family)